MQNLTRLTEDGPGVTHTIREPGECPPVDAQCSSVRFAARLTDGSAILGWYDERDSANVGDGSES